MALLTIAWRNIWRNGRRTAITVAAIALTTAILINTFALMEGMLRQLTDNITEIAAGSAQIHAKGYLDDRSIYATIDDPAPLLAAAKNAGIGAVARGYGFGLVASGHKSAGASFWGVDPAAEKRNFRIPKRVTIGRFLGDEPKGGVVIGRKLAKSLHAALGSEIVALVQAADGSLGNELFTVVGILSASGEDIDRGAVILHRTDFDRLFLLAGKVHEIALNTHHEIPLAAIAPALGALPDGLELETWRDLMPGMAKMMDMTDAWMWLIALIFFLAAGIGVMNTMLMATHDRVREYGVIRALGATPWRIVKDVAAEGWVISFVATVLGAALGVVAGWYFTVHGIDFGESAQMNLAGVVYDRIWYGFMTFEDFVFSVVTMWVICVVASLYPAIKAARLNTVEAMTHV